MVGTILLAPTVREIGVIEHMWTTGMPARSISLQSVAPQRVQVPQVDVRMTACTPSANNRLAISWPNFLELPTEVPLPTVA